MSCRCSWQRRTWASPDPVFERTLRTIATVDHLPGAVAFLHQSWLEGGLPEDAAFPFDLALDEVFMNVVLHGTSPSDPPREVTISLRHHEAEVTLVIADDGPAFDPLSLAAPDTSAAIDEREIGGLGVYMVRQMMDDVSYARVGTRNQLTMRKAVT